jgi:hypothetical protein
MSGIPVGYVTVNERLKAALERWPDLRVVELPFEIHEIAGEIYLWTAVDVYPTPDETRPIRGSVLEPIRPERHPLHHSELMTGFTSGLGRALGYLGLGIDAGIATSDEINARQPGALGTRAARPAQKAAQAAERMGAVQRERENVERLLEAFPDPEPAPGGRRKEPTEKMIGFYRTLIAERGLDEDPDILADFDACKAEIDRLKEIPRP